MWKALLKPGVTLSSRFATVFILLTVLVGIVFSRRYPKELYLFGEPAHFSAIATYSIGFFAFWIVCAASSLTTLFFQRTSNEINQSDSI